MTKRLDPRLLKNGSKVTVAYCLPESERKPKPKNIMLEDNICIHDIVPNLKFMENHKQFHSSVRWRKIANEAYHKSVIVGAKQKRMGKKPGCGDYLLTWRGGWGWVEVKTPTGEQSDSQKAFEKECLETGGKYSVVHNGDELRAAMKEWGILK